MGISKYTDSRWHRPISDDKNHAVIANRTFCNLDTLVAQELVAPNRGRRADTSSLFLPLLGIIIKTKSDVNTLMATQGGFLQNRLCDGLGFFVCTGSP